MSNKSAMKVWSKLNSRSISTAKKPMTMTKTIWLVATVLILVGIVQCQAYNEPTCELDAQRDCANTSKTTLSELFDIACTQTGLARCVLGDLTFDDDRRIIRAKRDIPKHGLLIGLTDELQITLLHALRDPRIQSIYETKPKMALTGTAPFSETYLAIYLVLESMRLRTGGDEKNLSPKERVHRAYFDYLPTLDDFLQFHPVAKKVFDAFSDGSDESKNEKPQKRTSYTPFIDQNTDNLSNLILHEYKAFFKAYENFDDLVSLKDYVWARLIVKTRPFHQPITEDDIDDDEMLEFFDYLLEENREDLGMALRPLFDAFNDHNQMNLGWMDGWQETQLADPMTVVYAHESIQSGTELLLSYEDSYPDFQKLSQYGFVNTDGSEFALATLAPYHRPYSASPQDDDEKNTNIRKYRMWRYLNYMDGYEICPKPDLDEEGIVQTSGDKNENLFQYARMKALKSIFNKASFWGMSMPLSLSEGLTAVTDKVMTTCRILAITERDYEGKATALLGKMAMDPASPLLMESKNEALEYRAFHVLERLATEVITGTREVLVPLITTSSDASIDVVSDAVETEVRRQLDSNEINPSSAEGMKAYILMREIDSLQMVVALAREKKDFYLDNKQKKLDNGDKVDEEDYIIRTEHCPEDPISSDSSTSIS